MAAVTLFDSSFKEIGPHPINGEFKCGLETSSTVNTFEPEGSLPSGTYGMCILGTEAGGIIDYTKVVDDDLPEMEGYTWRGLLGTCVVCPPSGQNYYTVSNQDANTALRNLLSNFLGGLFVVPNRNSGITISSYQFELYVTALTGIQDMLDSVGAKLVIWTEKDSTLGKVVVYAEAKLITSIDTEYDAGTGLSLEFISDYMGYNHMICRGKGELQNRVKCDLYQKASRKAEFTETKEISGVSERQYFYEYNSADTVAKLKESALKKFASICQCNKITVKGLNNTELDLGDRIKGRYKKNGYDISVDAQITAKTYKIKDGHLTIECEV